METIPLLLKPRVWALRNYCRRSIHSAQQRSRDIVLLLVGIGLMVGIYLGGRWSLKKLEDFVDIAYLDPATVLGLIFVFLFSMLILSGGAHAYGALFLSRDLDLLFASPIPRYRFFIGRFFEILFGTCWIVFLMLLPVILAFGVHYAAGPEYYAISILLILPFCLIPISHGIVLATVLAYFVPPHRARYVVYLICILGMIGLGYLLHFAATAPGMESYGELGILLRFVNLFSLPNRSWMPSFWLARIMSRLLGARSDDVLLYLGLLLANATAVVSLAFLVVSLLHRRVYLGSYADNRERESRWFKLNKLQALFPFIALLKLVMLEKELKMTTRDSLQMLHVLLFAGICSMYLYFLSVQQQIEGTFPADGVYWRIFLVLTNTALEAFVVIAACTRFVFPSVSLEGRSYWVLRASPVALNRLLEAKIFCWTVVVGLLTSLIFAVANYSIYGGLALALGKFALNLGVSVGLVSIAVCLGACFANFDWDHESQLAASFGSIAFMLTAIIFSGVMLFFSWSMAYVLNSPEINWSTPLKSCFCLGIVFFVWIINIFVLRIMVAIGERSLLAREASEG